MSPANHRQRTEEEQKAIDAQDSDARDEMRALEQGESVPRNPQDWPTGKAKFLTFGNEDDDAYGDGATAMLGPAGLELHADGSQTVRGHRLDQQPTDDQPQAPAAEKRERGWFARRFTRA